MLEMQECTFMYTRHWYDRNAVGEALQIAAGSLKDPFRKPKLIFWTYELVLSEEEEYLWEILEKVAMRWGSSATFATLNTKDPLHFLQSILSLPMPPPYDPPMSCDSCDSCEGVPEKPVAWTMGQRKRLWLAVQDAVQHKRPLRILRLLGGLAPQVAAEYLGLSPTKKGIYHMLEMVGIPAPLTHNTVVWPVIPIGRIGARLFALPRSLLSKGSIDPSATKTEGCAFWRRIWANVEEDVVWNTYFLDDIPDEWSAAELAKSHDGMMR